MRPQKHVLSIFTFSGMSRHIPAYTGIDPNTYVQVEHAFSGICQYCRHVLAYTQKKYVRVHNFQCMPAITCQCFYIASNSMLEQSVEQCSIDIHVNILIETMQKIVLMQQFNRHLYGFVLIQRPYCHRIRKPFPSMARWDYKKS